jgi:hypothetical protein
VVPFVSCLQIKSGPDRATETVVGMLNDCECRRSDSIVDEKRDANSHCHGPKEGTARSVSALTRQDWGRGGWAPDRSLCGQLETRDELIAGNKAAVGCLGP